MRTPLGFRIKIIHLEKLHKIQLEWQTHYQKTYPGRRIFMSEILDAIIVWGLMHDLQVGYTYKKIKSNNKKYQRYCTTIFGEHRDAIKFMKGLQEGGGHKFLIGQYVNATLDLILSQTHKKTLSKLCAEILARKAANIENKVLTFYKGYRTRGLKYGRNK